MGFFGRRKPTEPAKEILPRELWDDPRIGGLLKELGFSPDDPSNRPLTQDDVDRMMAAGRRSLEETSRQIHEKLPPTVRLRPFWLIPTNCWNGEAGHFLLYMLRFNPFDDWNTRWLPADEVSASVLDAPMHPGSDIPAYATAGEKFILNAKKRLMAAHAEAQRTHEMGKFFEAFDRTEAEIKNLAAFFGANLMEAHQMAKAQQTA